MGSMIDMILGDKGKRGNFLFLGKVPPDPLKNPPKGNFMGRCPKPCELLKKFDQNFYLPSAWQK